MQLAQCERCGATTANDHQPGWKYVRIRDNMGNEHREGINVLVCPACAEVVVASLCALKPDDASKMGGA